jgi:hypothetical protein
MGFKTGAVVGFAAGYVLGARAGRARYEQVRRWWGEFMGSPTVHQVAEKGRDLAGAAGRRGVEAVQSGVEKASTSVRNRLHGDGDAMSTGELPP